MDSARPSGGKHRPDNALTVSYIYAARYDYSAVVFENDNHLLVFPREEDEQQVLDTRLWVVPVGVGETFCDQFGNAVQRYRVTEPHTTLVIAASGLVKLSTGYPRSNEVGIARAIEPLGATEHTAPSPLIDPGTVSGLARDACGNSDSLLETVRRITSWVYGEVRYLRGRTTVATTAAQVASTMEGVCQDKAHLAIGMLRSLGVPCRYLSGLLAGQKGETHSWLEFLHPEDGWLGADPTRNVVLPPACDYVRFATGRDYSDVPPVAGGFVSTGQTREHAVISASRFDGHGHNLEDALELLKHAHVVRTEAMLPGKGQTDGSAYPTPSSPTAGG